LSESGQNAANVRYVPLSDIRDCDILGYRFSCAGPKMPENLFEKIGALRLLHSSNHVGAVGTYLHYHFADGRCVIDCVEDDNGSFVF
jgi:hypothetical protein